MLDLEKLPTLNQLREGASHTFAALGEIGVGFVLAKSSSSEGGSDVTVREICNVSARGAGVWADADGEQRRISNDDLAEAFRDAGWEVY